MILPHCSLHCSPLAATLARLTPSTTITTLVGSTRPFMCISSGPVSIRALLLPSQHHKSNLNDYWFKPLHGKIGMASHYHPCWSIAISLLFLFPNCSSWHHLTLVDCFHVYFQLILELMCWISFGTIMICWIYHFIMVSICLIECWRRGMNCWQWFTVSCMLVYWSYQCHTLDLLKLRAQSTIVS